ncbi:tannase/feruloyl esterase family alpha/beta hydrolase [Phenylobacterium montanum]|uniref:Tannase/feruloyl esterase family alpha/beta hydrolase n=1 Tax=Phenylobacterium montanum TaxID=2823693 RepID=A0A975FZF5_9CAUL|nr:tannase/feruloyl esterase family alpha/beta hydrolase [Caulobacter sp. S6]QUD88318.1 tannase/feruloyl esterase family alpha/beta hydrolase [Caulobacter sp. S6]
MRSALWAALLGAPALALAPSAASAAAFDCAALRGAHEDGVVVEAAEALPAGPVSLPGMGGPPVTLQSPAVCKVTGVIEPRKAPDGTAYGVRFELRLPAPWNGRFLFQGGGGLDGSVLPAVGAAGSGAPALARGYAVLSMDGGHEGRDASFAADQQARLDYAYQAVGKATAAAKALIRAYYNRGPQRSYFMGCSNGGREAMMAVQRYPLEFDGAVAGAPGYRLSRAAIQEAFANRTLAAIAPRDAQGRPDLARALSDADLKLVSEAVLKACDAQDGLADGLVSHPAACAFSPRSLACKPGQASGCVAPDKIAALEAVVGGAKDSQGRALYSRYYWDSGISELGWRMWMLGVPGQMPALNVVLGGDAMSRYFMTPAQPGRSPFDIDLDQALVETAQTAAINDATSTFLNSFSGHGGKLILYHGVSDPVFSAADTVGWYEDVQHNDPASAAGVRLFLVPAMNHCGGGRATDQFDMLSAIEAWVEEGRAPESVLAKGGPELPGVSRPLCAYPAYPRYTGGDPKAADGFVCEKP